MKAKSVWTRAAEPRAEACISARTVRIVWKKRINAAHWNVPFSMTIAPEVKQEIFARIAELDDLEPASDDGSGKGQDA